MLSVRHTIYYPDEMLTSDLRSCIEGEETVQQQIPPQQQISIQLDDDAAEGIYANLAMIIHSPTEIIIDFARVMPRMAKAKVLSRIIMTPMHAKMLHQALTENLKKFEAQFGEIKIHGAQNQGSKNIGFESSTHRVAEDK